MPGRGATPHAFLEQLVGPWYIRVLIRVAAEELRARPVVRKRLPKFQFFGSKGFDDVSAYLGAQSLVILISASRAPAVLAFCSASARSASSLSRDISNCLRQSDLLAKSPLPRSDRVGKSAGPPMTVQSVTILQMILRSSARAADAPKYPSSIAVMVVIVAIRLAALIPQSPVEAASW